ncbi:hypothetical protein [Hydrogenophaga sp.]|uniref:hypothetical protein n=1 Tax=Hydrogenophaga sp. TaxID=1904254 RepID=UPI0035AE532C
MSASMLDVMRAAGLAPHKDLDLRDDGKPTRYRVLGDKARSRNGCAVPHSLTMLCGAIGSWKTGETHAWHGNHKQQTPDERAELKRQLQAMRAARDAERDKAQFLRWLSGAESVQWAKFTALMDKCGNDVPVLWMLHQRGYDRHNERRRESRPEAENSRLREDMAALRRVMGLGASV